MILRHNTYCKVTCFMFVHISLGCVATRCKAVIQSKGYRFYWLLNQSYCIPKWLFAEHFMSLSSRIFYVLNFSSSPDPIPIRILEKSARSTLRPGYDDSPMKSLPSTYQSYHFHWLHPVWLRSPMICLQDFDFIFIQHVKLVHWFYTERERELSKCRSIGKWCPPCVHLRNLEELFL